jgi:hypothetical protein
MDMAASDSVVAAAATLRLQYVHFLNGLLLFKE